MEHTGFTPGDRLSGVPVLKLEKPRAPGQPRLVCGLCVSSSPLRAAHRRTKPGSRGGRAPAPTRHSRPQCRAPGAPQEPAVGPPSTSTGLSERVWPPAPASKQQSRGAWPTSPK